MEIKFNYKKSKQKLKKEIEKYILCSMIIFKQTQIKFDKDFILSEPIRHTTPILKNYLFYNPSIRLLIAYQEKKGKFLLDPFF